MRRVDGGFHNTLSLQFVVKSFFCLTRGAKISRRFKPSHPSPPGSRTLPFDIDLVVRSGGEMRLSDFCPWETSYAELVSVEEMWPEVDGEVLDRVLGEWAGRRKLKGSEGK